jgi:hypothetical protein
MAVKAQNVRLSIFCKFDLTVAKVLDRDGVRWVKPKTRFGWTDDAGKVHNYSPDLYLPEFNVYLDPKNSYCCRIHAEKIKRVRKENGVKLIVVPVELIEEWETTQFCLPG